MAAFAGFSLIFIGDLQVYFVEFSMHFCYSVNVLRSQLSGYKTICGLTEVLRIFYTEKAIYSGSRRLLLNRKTVCTSASPRVGGFFRFEVL
jgi:isochorismate hydrolase